MPVLSVIIPIYRAENFLRACLDSVLGQTFEDFEVICINDGSLDNSGEILNEYAGRDSRIIIVNQKNSGVSTARNNGLDRATGTYIHFMDADDYLDPGYYEKMLGGIKDADADMSCSGYVSNSKYTRGVVYKRDRVATTLSQKLLKTTALYNGYIWRYVFKRDFIEKNKMRFRTDLTAQEDTVFLLDAMVLANKVSIVAGPVYHYILNEDSILNRRDPAHHQKVKQDYRISKIYRAEFARKHRVMYLWRLRKILNSRLIGPLFYS
ncbi:glycosyltransferase [Lachnospiraceae bacterium OttesenSCG-928-E19]|nr:glycosyltransferase [Lachnospiraceae bacterium OttesenSCG-928-E19]